VLACLSTVALAAAGTLADEASRVQFLESPGPHEAWVSAADPVDPDQGEVPYDPPLIRPWPLEVSPPASVVRGPFESVQVNVDANGNNILDDAANEPSIAIDPGNPDRIVIGWRQFDSIQSSFRQAGYAYSHDGGLTWTFPGVLDPGVFRSDPVVQADADGNFYFYSLTSNGKYTCHMFKSTDGGVLWTDPLYAYGGDKEWFSVDRTGGMGHGHIYCAWDHAGCCEPYRFTRSIDGAASFEEPIELLGNPIWGTTDIGINGEFFASGVKQRNRGVFRLTRSSDAKNPGVTPTFDLTVDIDMGGRLDYFLGRGPNPGGLMGQVWVAVDHSNGPTRGNVYMLSSVNPWGDDPLDVIFARSTDNGRTWTGPRRVNDDPVGTNAWQWFGTIAVAPSSGRIDVIWNDTRNTGEDELSEMFYAYSTDAGETWSKNIPVTPVFDSHDGWPRQNKLGDYYDMISDELGPKIAYAATFNGEQDVYFLPIAIDCNGNGLHDGDDIASGRSKDANGNGIPDECELTCELIRKFKVKCRNTKLKVKVKSSMVEGIELTIDNNGDQRVITLDHKGNGKVKWRNQTGVHTVRIVECPEYVKVVDCGS